MSRRMVAIVPMRHHSERVPGKNYRDCAGRPLYCWVVEALLDCPSVDLVVIDTDSPTIREQAGDRFPQVEVLERPEHLRAGTTPMNDVLLHTTGEVEAEFYLQTHSTNPLVTASTFEAAVLEMLEIYPEYDSLFGVTRLQTRLWDSLARPINHNAAILLRTQDLPPVFEENSCLYIFTRELLQQHHNRIGRRPRLFEISAEQAWDIDEESDFRVAELLLQQRRAGDL